MQMTVRRTIHVPKWCTIHSVMQMGRAGAAQLLNHSDCIWQDGTDEQGYVMLWSTALCWVKHDTISGGPPMPVHPYTAGQWDIAQPSPKMLSKAARHFGTKLCHSTTGNKRYSFMTHSIRNHFSGAMLSCSQELKKTHKQPCTGQFTHMSRHASSALDNTA